MMNIHNTNKNKISYILLRILYNFDEFHKKTRCYGTDTPLFNAEIHMLTIIKENEGIHITGIADKLGVTKGAVSQIVNKLNKKGFIIKETNSHNLSKLSLSLTPKGEVAEANHQELHNTLDLMVQDIIKDASKDNIEFLKYFLNSFEERYRKLRDKD